MDFQEGKELGIREKTKEMIINMYKDNLSAETISKYANLSIEEVQEIINAVSK